MTVPALSELDAYVQGAATICATSRSGLAAPTVDTAEARVVFVDQVLGSFSDELTKIKALPLPNEGAVAIQERFLRPFEARVGSIQAARPQLVDAAQQGQEALTGLLLQTEALGTPMSDPYLDEIGLRGCAF